MLVDTSISILIFKEDRELIFKILAFKKLEGIREDLSTYFMRFMGIMEYVLMIIFVLTRAFEHRLLNFFIIYQHKFRLEDLNIVKDKYQKLELKFSKYHKVLCIAIGMPNIIFLLIRIFYEKNYYILIGIHLYTLCSTVLVMSYYQDSVLNLLLNMYKFHRIEFKKHFWKMMRLFIFTEFGLLFMCTVEFLLMYEASCLKAYLKDDEAMFDSNNHTVTAESRS